MKITNWGATIVSVILPDSKGNLGDVALGYDSLASYVNDTTYFGALVGRVANRIANAAFTLDGKTYKLVANANTTMLHGGHRGFSRVIWTVVEHVGGDYPFLKLFYHSFDGEQGFPGYLDVYVTYQITGDYEYQVTMRAIPHKKATPVNLAQHTYWNLAGHSSGPILSHSVQLFASHITPVDSILIPTGDIAPVSGTPYDFNEPNTVGSRISQLSNGYDINYVLNSPRDAKGVRKAAVVKDDKSGRTMELWTDQIGLQFYTGNALTDVVGKGGAVYKAHAGLCLETQGFPDAVNIEYFPSQFVRPGEIYRHYMKYKFSF
ncbi:hypothetical protein QJS10_CPB18g01330 [Acorus calamus]|uniref:Aldose 1-epimerase n=1 Tax=Acorus calamus TaxID=4465 RepID=A0AAV9CM29_ACOCL|nr:hypothetical protein QJS10_CPB18g01330 [Acorus calamus]